MMNSNWIEENIVKYKLIKDGHTNKSYYLKTKTGSYFYQIFQYDKYNHKINYKILSDFSFVPKTFFNSKKELITEYYKNQKLQLNENSLTHIAQILKTIHTSNKKFPKCNINKRIKYYFSIIKNKKEVPKELLEYKKLVLQLQKQLSKDAPCHNDPWINNFIYSRNKYYLTDWEYATMNNKHFDLAFFITGSYLTPYQEKIFLDEYKDYDKKLLDISKIIVFYITLLWIFKQDVIPFPYKPLLREMKRLINSLN